MPKQAYEWPLQGTTETATTRKRWGTWLGAFTHRTPRSDEAAERPVISEQAFKQPDWPLDGTDATLATLPRLLEMESETGGLCFWHCILAGLQPQAHRRVRVAPWFVGPGRDAPQRLPRKALGQGIPGTDQPDEQREGLVLCQKPPSGIGQHTQACGSAGLAPAFQQEVRRRPRRSWRNSWLSRALCSLHRMGKRVEKGTAP